MNKNRRDIFTLLWQKGNVINLFVSSSVLAEERTTGELLDEIGKTNIQCKKQNKSSYLQANCKR